MAGPDGKIVNMLHEHGVFLLMGKKSWLEPIDKLMECYDECRP